MENERPPWATALALFYAATVAFIVYRDLFVPHVRETEVWFGLEVHGWAAYLTAPIHWALFAIAAWGFWFMRPWVWPAAPLYAFYVASSHVVWNLTSPHGGGWFDGLWQFGLFSVPAVLLLWARTDPQERRAGCNAERPDPR